MTTVQLAPVLRTKDAAAFLGIGESTFWRWVSQGRLPQGIKLSTRCTVWRQTDLEKFLIAQEKRQEEGHTPLMDHGLNDCHHPGNLEFHPARLRPTYSISPLFPLETNPNISPATKKEKTFTHAKTSDQMSGLLKNTANLF